MKVGVSYNLFDGEELLEYSIKSIRNNVHHVSVVYQTVSNLGNPASSDVKEKLEKLKEAGMIDEIYHYEPNLKLTAHQNEKIKRDIGLKLAKKNGCNYFMSMDVDEFYDEEQLKNALDRIIKSFITTSAVKAVEYLKEPENQLIGAYTFTPKEDEMYDFYFPFVIKINKFFPQHHGTGYFSCYTDPTRKLPHCGRFKLFSAQEIVLHHMSTVRNNLAKKYANSSINNAPIEILDRMKDIQSKILDFEFEKARELPKDCAIFGKNIVRKVDNRFDINL